MTIAETSSASEIIPRRVRVDVPARTRRHWFGGDPASTHIFNALSAGFPRGEKMFVDAVRTYKDQITDPKLAEAVRRFVAQETNHSRAHEAFNDWVRGHGLPVGVIEAEVARQMDAGEKLFSPEYMLAGTAALEHFTALLAHALIESPGFLDAIDDDVRTLWLWHAIEELEHKAVAIDVYRHVGGRESVRIAAMVVLSLSFVHDSIRQQALFMRADGHGRNVASYERFARTFFGKGGFLSGMLAPYLAYYRRDFHPSQVDDKAALSRARAMLEARSALAHAA